MTELNLRDTTLITGDRLTENNNLAHATAEWDKARERLCHLRRKKVRDSSPRLIREYTLALDEVEQARAKLASVAGKDQHQIDAMPL